MVVVLALGISEARDIALEVAQSFVEVAGDIAGSNLTALGKMPRSCKIVAPSHPASFAETSASLTASCRPYLAE